MRLLIKLTLWLLFLSPFAIALLFWLALSNTPLVAEKPSLSHTDLARARAIVEQHRHQQNADQPLQLVLGERDLELAATYLARRLTESSLRIRIRDNRLQAAATLWVPGFPSRPYLNLQLELRDLHGEPNLVHLQIDRFVVPRAIAKRLLAELLIRLYQTEEYRLAQSIVDALRLQDRQLHLRYRWTAELASQARATFLDEPQSARRVYRSALRELLQNRPTRSLELSSVLPPLFRLAQQRSQQADPVRENRALLKMLGYWASTRRTLATDLLGIDEGPPLRFRARLNRRRDQARHFLISAGIAASLDDTAADLAGTVKELADAERGSGFSFVDLAADLAGARFGELAVDSARMARRLQQLVAAGIKDSDIMPGIAQLTEGLDRETFDRHYGDLASPRYRAMIERIETQVEHCRVYTELNASPAKNSINS